MNTLETQIGGSHYKSLAIQPAEYCQRNGLRYCEANVVKYVTRHRDKRGREDLEKAIHYLQLLIEMEYPQQKKSMAEAVRDAVNPGVSTQPRRVTVRWRCPACGHDHVWYWDKHEIFDGECGMFCDECNAETQCIGDGTGNYTPAPPKEWP